MLNLRGKSFGQYIAITASTIIIIGIMVLKHYKKGNNQSKVDRYYRIYYQQPPKQDYINSVIRKPQLLVNKPFEIEFKLNKEEIKKLKSQKYDRITSKIFLKLCRISFAYDNNPDSNGKMTTFILLHFAPTLTTKYQIFCQIIHKETDKVYIMSTEVNKDNYKKMKFMKLDFKLDELNDESLTFRVNFQILPFTATLFSGFVSINREFENIKMKI